MRRLAPLLKSRRNVPNKQQRQPPSSPPLPQHFDGLLSLPKTVARFQAVKEMLRTQGPTAIKSLVGTSEAVSREQTPKWLHELCRVCEADVEGLFVRSLLEQDQMPAHVRRGLLLPFCDRLLLGHRELRAASKLVPMMTAAMLLGGRDSSAHQLPKPRQQLGSNNVKQINASEGKEFFHRFLEACGQSVEPAKELPAGFEVTVRREMLLTGFEDDANESLASPYSPRVLTSLAAMAPNSQFWRTLLEWHHRQHLKSANLDGLVWVASEAVSPRHAVGTCRLKVEIPVEEMQRLREEQVETAMKEPTTASMVPSVLFEDETIAVIDKPGAIPTVRDAFAGVRHAWRGEDVSRSSSASALQPDVLDWWIGRNQRSGGPDVSLLPNAGRIHRLDHGTSGVMVFAKTEAAVAALRYEVRTGGDSHDSHVAKKEYIALCVAIPAAGEKGGSDDGGPLWYTSVGAERMVRDRRDAAIATRVVVEEVFFPPVAPAAAGAPKSVAGVRVRCHVSRAKKHQVRIHLASLGLPIMGDVQHGGGGAATSLLNLIADADSVDETFELLQQPWYRRFALHADVLRFSHPITREQLEFRASLPRDMGLAQEQLRAPA